MGFRIWYPVWFSVFLFGLLFLLDLSGNYAPPLISHNRESSVCSSRH